MVLFNIRRDNRMRSRYRFSLGLLLSLLLLGCSSKREITLQPEPVLPGWYTSPPVNDSRWLSGVGSGSTPEEATQNALADLLARLSVRVESEFNSEQSYQGGVVQESSRSQIRTQVAALTVSQYDVVSATLLAPGRYGALVRSDRAAFTRALQDEVTQGFDQVAFQIGLSRNDHLLKRYQTVRDGLNRLSALQPQLQVLSVLQPGFDRNRWQSRMQTLQSQQAKLRQQLVFQVSAEPDAQPMLPVIRQALTGAGYALSQNSAAIRIHLNSQTVFSRSSGIEIADVTLFLNSATDQGVQIGARQLPLTGYSTRGRALAEADAVTKLSRQIEEQGIEALLAIGL